MRRTLHLVSARDCLALRPLHREVLVKRMVATLRSRLGGVDLDELARAGEALFAREELTLPEAGRALQKRWPHVAPRDLGDALSSLVALVQVPPRGVWGHAGPARNTTVAAWLGREVDDPPPPDALVLRYLAAYGPAATADMRAWSGLAGLRAAVDRLRPQLLSFRDERGRELLDLPDAPLPDPGTPAPPRFLPAFDNAVLGFDDRSRIIDDADRRLSVLGARFLLVDGRVAGTWTTAQDGGALYINVSVDVTAHRRLTAAERDDVEQEGARLAAFLADGDPVGGVRLTAG